MSCDILTMGRIGSDLDPRHDADPFAELLEPTCIVERSARSLRGRLR